MAEDSEVGLPKCATVCARGNPTNTLPTHLLQAAIVKIIKELSPEGLRCSNEARDLIANCLGGVSPWLDPFAPRN
jgi:hypothetical protein